MRADSEVQDRIRHLLTVELDRRVAAACSRLPQGCRHNHRHPLDIRKKVAGETNEWYNRLSSEGLPVIGLCMLNAESPAQWQGTICEDPIDAQRCPYFTPVATKETVAADFYTQLKDLEWVARNVPEIYGLLWALGSESVPKLPWWKALWFRFLRVRPDPLVITSLPSGG